MVELLVMGYQLKLLSLLLTISLSIWKLNEERKKSVMDILVLMDVIVKMNVLAGVLLIEDVVVETEELVGVTDIIPISEICISTLKLIRK
jgi:hypothetical protein